MAFSVCTEAGSGVMGLLFDVIGSKTTIFCYSIASSVLLICLFIYIYFSKGLNDYEKHAEESDGENDKFIIYKRVNYLTVKYSYTAEETTVYVLSILY